MKTFKQYHNSRMYLNPRRIKGGLCLLMLRDQWIHQLREIRALKKENRKLKRDLDGEIAYFELVLAKYRRKLQAQEGT